MTWDAAMQHEQALDRIRTDHGLVQAAHETAAVEAMQGRYGTVSYRQGHRRGFWDGVMWLLHQQLRIDDLSGGELARELAKETGSIFWPVKAADPKFWWLCDRCRTRQLFDARGLCDNCGHDITEEP